MIELKSEGGCDVKQFKITSWEFDKSDKKSGKKKIDFAFSVYLHSGTFLHIYWFYFKALNIDEIY